MPTTDSPSLPNGADALEPIIADVESKLAALAQALYERDSAAIEGAATALQRALALALDAFTIAARRGPVPATLRQRLVHASGAIATQRETLARATAALDRAIDILLPRDGALYTARGTAAHATQSGSAQA